MLSSFICMGCQVKIKQIILFSIMNILLFYFMGNFLGFCFKQQIRAGGNIILWHLIVLCINRFIIFRSTAQASATQANGIVGSSSRLYPVWASIRKVRCSVGSFHRRGMLNLRVYSLNGEYKHRLFCLFGRSFPHLTPQFWFYFHYHLPPALFPHFYFQVPCPDLLVPNFHHRYLLHISVKLISPTSA